MNERTYRLLKTIAITLVTAWIGWSIYDGFLRSPDDPMDNLIKAAERDFEDQAYQKALAHYDRILTQSPHHLFALRGRARTLLMLTRYRQAKQAFDEAIAQEPEFANTWANRGILHDRMGAHEQALSDYEQALRLDPSIADGPHWMTRFLRLQATPPPTIADRARYLRAQLALPETERLLQNPEEDDKQRPYKR
uniref:Tetratricopeptide repeat-containing protein n=1 Tax=Candidatus Kentrum sp. MB TaxID=2138164 RepID=A0A451BDE9_9GAMM|nr:MAG: Tetratricopeptide repeat-containing protein [Candidatus Kentron sp. MB]VFK33712.1 MAG: Tetratricopeptide repeat-containing protein [Candidatus Kentron sp. MB]VFK76314.1 MAG: Tetratricopeptide repeat-containing protein [Candidatus Kentron sp. MB]